MAERALAAPGAPASTAERPTDNALEIEGVTVSFGELRAVNDVSLSVRRGSIQGVVGPNGAGKSTLFNAISGFQAFSAGTVTFEGRDISGRRPHAIARLGLRRTFQATRPIGTLSVLENVMAGAYPKGRTGMWGALFSTPNARREERRLAEQALAALEALDIRDLADSFPRGLTAGQLRLLEIARTLVSRPSCMLLDEPAAGLSQAEARGLAEALRTIVAGGVTILLIEHDLDLVLTLCDRIAVLDFGVMIARGTPAEIRANVAVRDAYLGADVAEPATMTEQS